MCVLRCQNIVELQCKIISLTYYFLLFLNLRVNGVDELKKITVRTGYSATITRSQQTTRFTNTNIMKCL